MGWVGRWGHAPPCGLSRRLAPRGSKSEQPSPGGGGGGKPRGAPTHPATDKRAALRSRWSGCCGRCCCCSRCSGSKFCAGSPARTAPSDPGKASFASNAASATELWCTSRNVPKPQTPFVNARGAIRVGKSARRVSVPSDSKGLSQVVRTVQRRPLMINLQANAVHGQNVQAIRFTKLGPSREMWFARQQNPPPSPSLPCLSCPLRFQREVANWSSSALLLPSPSFCLPCAWCWPTSSSDPGSERSS